MNPNTMQKPLTVYKASAGSGKTFTLATEYIKLVVHNPQSYRSILAVTFTNKATEEMKMRILSQLYGIWKQLSDSKDYADTVASALGATPEFVSQRAGIALSNLLHNYNYFRVMTIDTFFQSVLRNLARELDLTTNLRVGLNDAQVEEQAVDLMIDDLQTTDALLQWLLRYIMENISDDKSWNVINQIKQFGKTIFRDYYKKESKVLNQTLAQKGFFEHYSQVLRQMRTDASERMKQLGQEFYDILSEEGLQPADLANKERGIASFFNKLRNGVFDESIENQTVANHLENPEKWYPKSSNRKELIHTLAEGRLGNLLRTAIAERPNQWKRYKSADLTLRHLNQLRLLSSIEQRVHELNAEANRFLLSDTQQLLHALIQETDSPFIFEKIGSQLEHVMIDEFQDTSTVQWKNFRVLLQETMSHQGSENLIVGDVKQSIYRWRSGDWRLLNNIQQEFSEAMIDVKTLRFNRRSARNIVDFNNAFFTEAEQQERALLSDDPESGQLQRAYADVCQLLPEKDGAAMPSEGLVDVKLLPAAEYQEQTLSHLTDTILSLRDKGIPAHKTAILVRTNRYIPLIASYLMEHLPDVTLVSDEAFRLDASPAVNIIVQALHLLRHPDDQLAKAFLAKSLPGGIPQAYELQAEELSLLPLYELTEQLFAMFGLNRLDSETAYVCTFFDYLSEYIADRPADIDDFVKYWEDELCSKTIQSTEADGIRLISIHKSKGLEFDTVIIPFCDWQLEKQTGNIVWCSPDEAPFNQLPIIPIDYSRKNMVGTIYEKDYQNEHLQNVVDNLNLLYVAFTRARCNLFVIGRRDAKNSRSTILGSVLPQIAGDEHSPLPSAVFSGLGNPDEAIHFEFGTLLAAKDTRKTQSRNVFLQPAIPLKTALETYQQKAHFRQSNQSQKFIAWEDGEAEKPSPDYIQTGNILHSIFSSIRTTADIDHAIRQLESDGLIPSEQPGQAAPPLRSSLISMIRRRLEHPKVADWFSPRWTLFNECTILSVENGKTVERRPDRVMTDGHEWVVVDFKFGNAREEHHEQVRQYMSLLRQMGHAPVSGYLWYVYTNQIVPC